jgi:hypothetical protein
MKLMEMLMFTITASFAGQGAYAKDKNVAQSMSINFTAGSAKLNEHDKESMRDLVREGLQRGSIDHITVAAWSDKTLPGEKRNLTDTDRGLAKERTDVISDFLKQEMEVSDVDTYNMAESANWLARTFNTKEAELKSVFGRTDGANDKRAEFREIRRQGGPSLAVVVVNMDRIQ